MATAVIGTMAIKLAAKTDKFDTSLTKASKKLNNVAEAAKRVAVASGIAFAGIASAAAVAIRASSQQREAELGLAAAIKAANLEIDQGKILQRAKELQELTTFGDEATIAGASVLASFQLQEQAILDLLPLVQDLAAFNKVDLRSAALGVGKAFATSASALSRMGIVLSETQKQAFDAAEGMERAALLAEILKQNVGGAAQAMSQTASGAFLQMKNAAGDVAEEFGFMIEQPVSEFFGFLKGVLGKASGAMSRLSPETKKAAGTFALLGGAATGATAAISAIALALPSLVGGFKIMITTLKTLKVAFAGAFGPAGIVIAAATAVLGLMLGKLIAIQLEIAELEARIPKLIDEEAGRELDITVRREQAQEEATRRQEAFDALLGAGGSKEINRLLDNLNKVATGMGEVSSGTKKFGTELANSTKKIKGFDFGAGEGFAPSLIGGDIDTSGLGTVFAEGGEEMEAALDGVAADLAKFSAEAAVSTAEMVRIGGTLVSGVRVGGREISGAFGAAANALKAGASPIGIAGAAAAALLIQTEAFRDIMKSLNEVFAVAKGILAKVLRTFVPLIQSIVALALLVVEIAMVFTGFGSAMEMLRRAVGKISQFIDGVVRFIANTVNVLVDFLIKAARTILPKAGGIEKAAVRALRRGRITLPGEAVEFPQEEALTDLTDAATGATNSVGEMGEAAREVSAQLTNVAAGFKINLRRFQSITGEGPTATAGLLEPSEPGGPKARNIGGDTFNVDVPDVDSFIDKLNERDQQQSSQVFRTSSKSGSFGTDRQGS